MLGSSEVSNPALNDEGKGSLCLWGRESCILLYVMIFCLPFSTFRRFTSLAMLTSSVLWVKWFLTHNYLGLGCVAKTNNSVFQGTNGTSPNGVFDDHPSLRGIHYST